MTQPTDDLQVLGRNLALAKQRRRDLIEELVDVDETVDDLTTAIDAALDAHRADAGG